MNQKAVKLNIIKENTNSGQQFLLEIIQSLTISSLKGAGRGTKNVKSAKNVKKAGDNLFSQAKNIKQGDSLEPLTKASKNKPSKLATYTKKVEEFLGPKIPIKGKKYPFNELLNTISSKVPDPSAMSTTQGILLLRNLLEDLTKIRQGLLNQKAQITALIERAPQGSILRSGLESVGGRIDDALLVVESTAKNANKKGTGMTDEMIETAIRQADNLDNTLPVAQRNLDNLDGVLDALPGGQTAPEQILALPAPQQAKVSGAIDDVVEAEVKALDGPPPPLTQGEIPQEIFRLPEKMSKLKILTAYAAAAGLTAGLIVVLAKADPSGALAEILGVTDGKKGKTGGGGGGKSPLGFTYDCNQFNRVGRAVTQKKDTKLATALIQAYLIINGQSPTKAGGAPDDQAKKVAAAFIKKPIITPVTSSFGIDGECGENTQNAVARFQEARKLDKDGIVGTNTWAALTGKAGSKAGSKTDGKADGQDAKKPEQVLTKGEKKDAEVTINQLLSRMRRAKKIQNIINAYIRFRERLILALRKIAGGGDMSMVTPSSRAGLNQIVSKTFPEFPSNLRPVQRYTFADNKFRELPGKIFTGQRIFANVDEKLTPEAILKLAIKILLDEEKEDYGKTTGVVDNPTGKTRTRDNKYQTSEPVTPKDSKEILDTGTSMKSDIAESKSYDIDFSRWKPMIKNSY